MSLQDDARTFFVRGILGHALQAYDLHPIDVLDGGGRRIEIREPEVDRVRVIAGRTEAETNQELVKLLKTRAPSPLVDLIVELANGVFDAKVDFLVEDLPTEKAGS